MPISTGFWETREDPAKVAKSPREKNRVLLQCIQQLYTADSIQVALGIGNYSLGSYFFGGQSRKSLQRVPYIYVFNAQLTTPENTITYHFALCLSPQNFA